jgi:Uma2 family endonuclease
MTQTLAHISEPQEWKFSREQYFQLADHGLFQNMRVEFLQGMIYEKPSKSDPQVEPAPIRWSCEDYDLMADFGYFDNRRVELIKGRIYEMPPQRVPHSVALELVTRYVMRTFFADYRIRIQMPFHSGDGSKPEPDVAVIAGADPRAASSHPSIAVLVIEVSETSIKLDRAKAQLYASSGVQEYWIVNVPRRVLQVHRDPVPSADPGEGWIYKSVQTLNALESISPLAAPQASVSVAELLP